MAGAVFRFAVREGGVERDDDLRHVVKEILRGAWRDFPKEDITITSIGGGITNLLFKLQGPQEEKPALVRIYGQDTDVLIDRERDNALFHELATMGFAPPFHGCFENGRIEGFLPARPLEPHEMAQRSPVDFVTLIAKEMAKLHDLLVTTAGTAGEAEMWKVLPKWLTLAKGLTFEDEAKAVAVAALDLDWVCREAEWVAQQLNPRFKREEGVETSGMAGMEGMDRDLAARTNGGVDERVKQFLSKVVLSHNDLLSGNILYAKGWDRVQVIDFEYSGYNHIGFDIANHFCEHAGFDSNFEKSFPTAETQVAFLRAYVQAATTVATAVDPKNPDNANMGSVVEDTDSAGVALEATLYHNTAEDARGRSPDSDEATFLEALRVQVNKWTLPSHLWWATWAVVQARYSPIDFDFLDYARLRLAGYRLHKEAFFGVSE